MTQSTGTSLMEHLWQVPDPRIERTRRHELMDILVIALCAVIGGADNWVDVVQFGKAKKEWFATFLKLPNGITSHDTFGRVFQLIDSQVLEKVCIEWLQSIAGQVQGVVAIDGKSVRGSGHGGQAALHIVSAWSCQAGMLLGQVQTDKKSNEITAIPELLKLLSIKGCIVTIDAMGCQKAITQAIVASEADYVLTLKGNHPHLHVSVRRIPFLRALDGPGSMQGVARRDGVHSTRTSAHHHGTSQRSPQGHQAQTQRGLQTQARQADRAARRLGRGHRAGTRRQCQFVVQVAPRTI